MAASDEEQCRALTGDGERCSRPAVENGFCHQHGESDETIDEDGNEAEGSGTEDTDEGSGDSTEGTESTGDDDRGEEMSDAGLLEVRDRVREVASELIGRDLDGITGIERVDSGWVATVEVVERHSVPDTQDLLGRYEIDLDGDGTVTGYHQQFRYRRDDTEPRE